MFSHFKSLSLRSKLLFLVVVIVSIFIPARFWHDVWFGRVLSDNELATALQSESKPRVIQHALAQIEQEIRAGQPEAKHWYPAVARLADHSAPVVRLEAAWVMGQDNSEPLFEKTLLRLLGDGDPLVRRNAALALVRFKRPEALPVIRSMLSPLEVPAPATGALYWRAEVGFRVELGDKLGRIEGSEGEVEIASPLTTMVLWLSDRSEVEKGTVILRLGVDPVHAREALRALFLLGTREDLPLVESLEERGWVTEEVRPQLEATIQALRQR